MDLPVAEHEVFNDLLWSTPMPVMLRFGPEVTPALVKGSCSLDVVDAVRFEEKVGDVPHLMGFVRAILPTKSAEVLVQASQHQCSLAELARTQNELARAVQAAAAGDFLALGLRLRQVVVHSVEKK
jgi:hypothetical protein